MTIGLVGDMSYQNGASNRYWNEHPMFPWNFDPDYWYRRNTQPKPNSNHSSHWHENKFSYEERTNWILAQSHYENKGLHNYRKSVNAPFDRHSENIDTYPVNKVVPDNTVHHENSQYINEFCRATSLSNLPGYSQAITLGSHHNKLSTDRFTPEIFEPRTSVFESETHLTRKVRPHSAEPLPSFKTFTRAVNATADADPTFNIFQERKKTKKPVKLKEWKQPCGCNITNLTEATPFYNHLGGAKTLVQLRETLRRSFNVEDKAMCIRLVKPTTKEGKNGDGCPLARWILRRSGPDEKYLVMVRENEGHVCDSMFTVVTIVAWEGISKQYADDMYKYLTKNLSKCGFLTRRRCGANESKNCMCQGDDEETQGASFSFGCSWSMFFDGCKFAKSTVARKFKMQHPQQEEEMEKVLQDMTTQVSPLLKIWSPKAYENMTQHESIGADCRIGHSEGRPFSGVTCCLDFCAHSHRDLHNMDNGTTMVCTLLKPDYNERSDEQLHVLPLYQLIDDDGNVTPTNFDIPKHFIKSKITSRHVTEGKGRYVNPVAVGVKKADFTSELSNDAFTESFMSPAPQFCNEQEVPSLVSSWQLPAQQNDKNVERFVDEFGVSLYRQMTGLPSSSGPLPSKKPKESKPTVITPDMGGVAIALGHGSFLIECAKKELHATTALRNPQRSNPTRLSMVFYQHKKLNKRKHGYDENQEKMRKRMMEKRSFDDLSLLADTASHHAAGNCRESNPLLALSQPPTKDFDIKSIMEGGGAPVWDKSEKLPTFSIFQKRLGERNDGDESVKVEADERDENTKKRPCFKTDDGEEECRKPMKVDSQELLTGSECKLKNTPGVILANGCVDSVLSASGSESKLPNGCHDNKIRNGGFECNTPKIIPLSVTGNGYKVENNEGNFRNASHHNKSLSHVVNNEFADGMSDGSFEKKLSKGYISKLPNSYIDSNFPSNDFHGKISNSYVDNNIPNDNSYLCRNSLNVNYNGKLPNSDVDYKPRISGLDVPVSKSKTSSFHIQNLLDTSYKPSLLDQHATIFNRLSNQRHSIPIQNSYLAAGLPMNPTIPHKEQEFMHCDQSPFSRPLYRHLAPSQKQTTWTDHYQGTPTSSPNHRLQTMLMFPDHHVQRLRDTSLPDHRMKLSLSGSQTQLLQSLPGEFNLAMRHGLKSLQQENGSRGIR